MKIDSYSICDPFLPIKQYTIMASDYDEGVLYPLVYLQRPKWITSDEDWEKIVKSIRIDLPKGIEIN